MKIKPDQEANIQPPAPSQCFPTVQAVGNSVFVQAKSSVAQMGEGYAITFTNTGEYGKQFNYNVSSIEQAVDLGTEEPLYDGIDFSSIGR